MRLIGKIAVFLIFGLGCGFGQCTVDQFVNNLPLADVNGAQWTIYDLTDPENRIVVETDPSCMTFASSGALFWMAELGYWSPTPGVGDSLIMLGSWDSAYVNDPVTYGDNPNHTGFYWLYSDIVDDVALTHWEDDTLRSLAQPIAAQVGVDIELSIENPAETRYPGQTAYDVLGYWLWADTTGAGIPNCYDKEVAFVPVQGGAGETTIYSHPIAGNYENSQTVYWAYYLVARPDTGGVSCPGYSSYYLSANSNPLVIIGIEETQIFNPQPLIPSLEIYPNPFKHTVRIHINVEHATHGIALKIYDAAGRLVSDFFLPANLSVSADISWDGTNQFGQEVKPGVYFCRLETNQHSIVEKMIKME